MEHLDQFEDLVICEKIEKIIYDKRSKIEAPSHHFNDVNALLSQDFFSMLKEDPKFNLNSISLTPEMQKRKSITVKNEWGLFVSEKWRRWT